MVMLRIATAESTRGGSSVVTWICVEVARDLSMGRDQADIVETADVPGVVVVVPVELS